MDRRLGLVLGHLLNGTARYGRSSHGWQRIPGHLRQAYVRSESVALGKMAQGRRASLEKRRPIARIAARLAVGGRTAAARQGRESNTPV